MINLPQIYIQENYILYIYNGIGGTFRSGVHNIILARLYNIYIYTQTTCTYAIHVPRSFAIYYILYSVLLMRNYRAERFPGFGTFYDLVGSDGCGGGLGTRKE